ncbi:MAG: CehA/McbA family metallohydrolase [Alphaproteobacteria bacterium]|nr:CehA/McbA family metallohydrolase [Alphaproteobacteria bacterium]
MLTVLLLLACGKDTPAPDSDVTLGADPGQPAAPGEARAGVVREDLGGLFGGVTAEGQAGDIKLYNHRVQFVIQGAREGNGYVNTGGHVIDLDVVREDGALGRDTVEDVFLSFGMARLFDAERVEIVDDGTGGGAAVVRARGRDVPWQFFQGLLERSEPVIGELNLEIEVEYRLEPDVDALEITTRLVYAGDEAVEVPAQDGLFVSGEDLLAWAPGRGLEGPAGGALEAQVYTGRWGEASFSSWPGEGLYDVGTLSQFASELGIFLADRPTLELGPGEQAELVRWLAVGPDTLAVEASRRQRLGEALAEVGGSVLTTEGEAVSGALVHFVDGEGAVAGFARSDTAGHFEGLLPPGEWTAYALAPVDREQVERPEGAGRYGPFAAEPVNAELLAVLSGQAEAPGLPLASGYGPAEPQTFSVAEGQPAELDLRMEPPAWLNIRLTDELGQLIPGVVDLRWDTLAPDDPVPGALRDALGAPQGSRVLWGWTYTGLLELPLRPGAYRLSAGQSWRHRRTEDVPLTLNPGDRVPADILLEEIVRRDGWLAMDSHLHAAPSFDGALPMADRLVTCAATGVDLPVTTDHDALVDYRALSEALGLDARLRVLSGLEVTTLLRGHFNLFPLTPSDAPNGGVVDWWRELEDTEALFARMRERGGDEALLQVNHPRAPGMFSLAQLDAEQAEPGEPDRWSWDFDLFELINEGGDGQEQVLQDWFAMLNRGERPIPMGVSDSHYRYIPCGMGRTDVYLGEVRVSDVSDEAVLEALRAGHVIVASGTTLRASLDGALPGDTVVGASAQLEVRVRAPDWIDPGTIRVFRNGELIQEQALAEADAHGIWFDGGWEVTAAEDAWFVVEVIGTSSLGDTWRGVSPFAMTNAFFLDVDGDGWEAPGL